MKRILIAVNSEIICQELADSLSGAFEVVTCQDGCDALDILRKYAPDLAVLELMLPNIDGVSVLQMARDVGIATKIVAISAQFSDYAIRALEKLQVEFLMRVSVGFCHSLVARVLDIADWDEPVADRKRIMRNTLAMLGFKVGGSGYHCLEAALELHVQNPNQHMVSQLYPAVALQCNGTVTQAEKAIRTCITNAWETRNDRIWRMYFPVGKNGKTVKPTNMEFISRITDCILNQTVSAEDKDMREIV